MKCESCRFLRTEGYEYPETYCGAGVAEGDERATSDGCNYHYKTLEKRERELDEAWDEDCPYDFYDVEEFYFAELADRDKAKPLNHNKGYYVCPSCNAYFITVDRDTSNGQLINTTPFCGNCGQRLDWEEA